MAESKQLWVPKDFNPIANVFYADLIRGLTGLGVPYPLYPDRLGTQEIYRSFNQFINNQVRSGNFRQSVEREAEKRPDLDVNKFILRTYFGHGKGEKPYDCFYFDGDFSLMLIYNKPKTTPWYEGVCISFSPLNSCLKDYSFSGYLNEDLLNNDDLIIIQLQATGRREEMKETFSHFRWERLLVNLVCRWARDSGFPRILFLPSKNNKWRMVNSNEHGAAYQRYDVTAQRCGFRRAKENGPYVLELQGDIRDFYQRFFNSKA